MMPGTDNGVIIRQIAPFQGQAHVGTSALHGVKLAFVVNKQDGTFANPDHTPLTFVKFILGKCLDPVHPGLLSAENLSL
jgi:hypothetical protein